MAKISFKTLCVGKMLVSCAQHRLTRPDCGWPYVGIIVRAWNDVDCRRLKVFEYGKIRQYTFFGTDFEWNNLVVL